MSKCDFNKVAPHGCSLVNLLHFSEHLFLGTPLGGCFCIDNDYCVACLNKMDILKTDVYNMSAHLQQNSIIAIFDLI